MLRLLFVSAALVGAASAAAQCTAAQMDSIGKCYTTFNKAYGIADGGLPLNQDYFESFHRQRSDMQKKDGISAKPAIQQYGAALTECLKPFTDCIVDSTYELAPLSCSPGGDGHRFNLDRVQTALECTDPGYSQQMRHFFCIDHFKALDSATSTDANRVKLTKCNNDLATAKTGKADTDASLCKAYQDNAVCYGQVFSSYCGAQEAGEFYCNLVKQEYMLWIPTCAFDCKNL